MLVATRALADAVLGGRYTSTIGRPHDAETGLPVIPDWNPELLTLGRMVYYKKDGRDEPFRLAQVISWGRNRRTDYVTLLVREEGRAACETLDAWANAANCRITAEVDRRGAPAAYDPPAGFRCFFQARDPGPTSIADEYALALVNRRTMSLFKLYSTTEFEHERRWTFFCRVSRRDAERWSDAAAPDTSPPGSPLPLSPQGSNASLREDVEPDPEAPLNINASVTTMPLHRHTGEPMSQLRINVFIILNHWAKYNYRYPESDEAAWSMRFRHPSDGEVQPVSLLTPQLFSIERCLLDWWERITAPPRVYSDTAIALRFRELRRLRHLFRRRSLMNPVWVGCDDRSALDELTVRAREMVERALESAFRPLGLRFTGSLLHRGETDPSDPPAFARAFREFVRLRDAPRPVVESLTGRSLLALSGQYIHDAATMELIRAQYSTPFTHAVELRPGDLIITPGDRPCFATVTRVVDESHNDEERRQYADAAHEGGPIGRELFRLDTHSLYYRLRGPGEYRTGDWRSVTLLKHTAFAFPRG